MGRATHIAGWCLKSPLIASALAVALAAAAGAQEAGDPLRFLRPGVDGETAAEPPATAEAPPEPATLDQNPQDEPAPAAGAVLELPPELFLDPAGTAQPLDDPAGEEPPPPASAEDTGAAEAGAPPQTGSDSSGAPAAETAQPAAPEPQPAAAAEEAAVDAAAPEAVPAAPEEDRNRTLRFGVLAGRDVTATMAATEPLAEGLRERLLRPVEILPMSSYGAMIDAQVTRRIDGGFYSAAAFAVAEAACGCLEPLVAPAAADGTIAYHSIVVARVDSGISSPADLDAKVVAVGPADSLGSRRMPLAALMAEGFDPGRFAGVREVASADEAVRLVLSGGADAAFAWSSLAGAADEGYSRGTLTDLVARGEASIADLAVVWRSPPVTHGPFAVLKALPEPDKRAIENQLLGLAENAPAAYDVVAPFYGGGYVAVEPADYDGVAALAAQPLDASRLPAAPAATVSPPAD